MSIESLQQSMIETLGKLPGIATCSAFPSSLSKIKVPALFIECVELEPGHDTGTEQLILISHWEAHLIVDDQQKDKLLGIVIMILLSIYKNRWQLKIQPAQLKGARPDYFKPDIAGLTAWVIEWSHELRIGDDVWKNPEIEAKEVTLDATS